jgi:hypothetical protein
MKTLLAIITFSMLSFAAMSQAYHPVLELNKYWDQSDEDWYEGCSFNAYRYFMTNIDSTMEGFTYKLCKTYRLRGHHPWESWIDCPPFTADTVPQNAAWLREDTNARKVYIYDQGAFPTSDQLLYDFALNVGDTLKSYYASSSPTVLVSIDTITLHNGESRKKYTFDHWSFGATYIEGIGGGFGFVLPLYIFEGPDRTLYCVKKDGEDIWGSVCNTVFVGMKNEPEISISVFPNPADDVLNINLNNISESNPYSFEMFDLNGTKILTTKLESSDNAVSLTNLSPGFYIYKIRSDATLKNGKLVKL